MSTDIDGRELRDAMREFLELESPSSVVRAVAGGDEALKNGLWNRMAELGWLGLGVPEAHGGLGCGPAQLAVAYEEFGRALTPLPFLSLSLVVQAIAQCGDAAQREHWLPRLAAGTLTATVALPEFNGTVHLSGAGSAGSVKGTLTHVADLHSQLLLVPCVSATFERSLALIEMPSRGVSVQVRRSVDATRTLGDVSFADVVVEPAQLMRVTAEAWTALLDHAALGVACDSIGGSALILDRTVDYMKTRTQFGRPIGSFQALKHRCASWKILQEAAEVLARNAGHQSAAGAAERSASASRAKYYAADTYAAIAGDAIQLHGGIGFTWEHDCHLYLKRAKLNQQLYGSSTLHRERIAADIFLEFRMPEGSECT